MDEMEFELKAKAAFEQIEDKARQMGLYHDGARAVMMPDGELVLMVDFVLGDVAFSDRVQNPQRYATDSMIRTMEKGQQDDDFLNERERIKTALAEGKDIFSALDGEPEDLGN